MNTQANGQKSADESTVPPVLVAPEKTSWISYIEFGLKILGLLGVLLTFSGFTFITGVAAIMNFDVGLLYASPFDILGVSWLGFTVFLSVLIDKINEKTIWEYGFYELLAAIGIVPVFLKTKLQPDLVEKIRRTPLVKPLLKRTEPLRKFWQKFISTKLKRPFSQWIFVIFGSLLGGWLVKLFLFGVSMVMLLLVVTAFTAHFVGYHYAIYTVVKPEKCATPVSRQVFLARIDRSKNEKEQKKTEKNKVQGVACVAVSTFGQKKELVASGRVLLSTTNYILLYNPDTGVVERVSLGGQTLVTQIDALPTKTIPVPVSPAKESK